mgnify:CR=1 FL=1
MHVTSVPGSVTVHYLQLIRYTENLLVTVYNHQLQVTIYKLRSTIHKLQFTITSYTMFPQ